MRYYKLGNSYNKASYEIVEKLKDIRNLLAQNKTSIYAGFLSAYAANVLSNGEIGLLSAVCRIVFFLILFHVVIHACIFKEKLLKFWKIYVKKDESNIRDEQAYYSYYMEILNNLIQATSLKNRYFELKNQTLENKEELINIYLQQAFFYYALVDREMDEKIFVKNSRHRNFNFEIIGRDNLKQVLIDAEKNVKLIQKEILDKNGEQKNSINLYNKFNEKLEKINTNEN